MSSNEVTQLYSFEADMPVITAEPENQTVAQGGTATFSVTATAGNPLTYQWFKDGQTLVGATSATLTLTNVQPNQIGYYSVGVSNAVAGVLSANAALNVSGYDFSQWQGLVAYYPFNGNADDASGNAFDGVVSGATLGANRFGTESAAFLFNGNSSRIDLPAGLVQLASGTGPLSASVWFRTGPASTNGNRACLHLGAAQTDRAFAIATSSGKLLYSQWGATYDALTDDFVSDDVWHQAAAVFDGTHVWVYVDGVLGATRAVVSNRGSVGARIGANLISYEFWDGAIDDVRIYNRALSADEVQQLYAYEADLSVITGQPQAQAVAKGGTATFTVTATAAHPLTYQWFKDGQVLAGATGATLTLTNVQPNQIGYYSVGVSNAVAGVLSANAALNVPGYDFSQWWGLVAYYPFSGNADDASGNGRNGSPTNCVPAPDRFGSANACYQLDGATSRIVINTNAWPGGNSARSVSTWFKVNSNMGNNVNEDLFTFGDGTRSNTRFTLAYYAYNGGWGINFLGQGNDYGVATQDLVGQGWQYVAVTFESGTGIIYFNGLRIGTFAKTLNTDGSMPLIIGSNSLNRNDEFFNGLLDELRIYSRALSSNEVVQLYASEADLPVITGQPQAQTVTQGGTATFNVTATAACPLTYQWFKDGQALARATGATLTLTNVQPNQIGYYSVGVSNAVAGVLSASAALNVSGHDFSQWQGLVAYYPFDGNAEDESGSGNDAAVNGASLGRDRFGNFGSAYAFDGSNDYLRVTHPVSTSSPFTWTVWSRFDDPSTNRAVAFLCQGGGPGAGALTPGLLGGTVPPFPSGTILGYSFGGTMFGVTSRQRSFWDTWIRREFRQNCSKTPEKSPLEREIVAAVDEFAAP